MHAVQMKRKAFFPDSSLLQSGWSDMHAMQMRRRPSSQTPACFSRAEQVCIQSAQLVKDFTDGLTVTGPRPYRFIDTYW